MWWFDMLWFIISWISGVYRVVIQSIVYYVAVVRLVSRKIPVRRCEWCWLQTEAVQPWRQHSGRQQCTKTQASYVDGRLHYKLPVYSRFTGDNFTIYLLQISRKYYCITATSSTVWTHIRQPTFYWVSQDQTSIFQGKHNLFNYSI